MSYLQGLFKSHSCNKLSGNTEPLSPAVLLLVLLFVLFTGCFSRTVTFGVALSLDLLGVTAFGVAKLGVVAGDRDGVPALKIDGVRGDCILPGVLYEARSWSSASSPAPVFLRANFSTNCCPAGDNGVLLPTSPGADFRRGCLARILASALLARSSAILSRLGMSGILNCGPLDALSGVSKSSIRNGVDSISPHVMNGDASGAICGVLTNPYN